MIKQIARISPTFCPRCGRRCIRLARYFLCVNEHCGHTFEVKR